MLPLPPFDVIRPRALAEALDALGDGRGVPIAGGTDLVPSMKRGLREPACLVSLRRLPELAGIRVDADGSLVLGAAATLAAIADDPRVAHGWPAVAQAAASVASPQIRNVATLGGNVLLDTRCGFYDQSRFWRAGLGHCLKTTGDACHVVPGGRRCVAAFAADTPPALIACGARVRLVSPGGERTLALAELYTSDGARNTVLRPQELLVDVRLPAPPPRTRGVYVKVRTRAAIDFPLLSIALTLTRDAGDAVQSLSLVLGAVASRPRVVAGLDVLVGGRRLDARAIEEVAERARLAFHPLPTIEGDPEWRRAVLPVHVRRALTALAEA